MICNAQNPDLVVGIASQDLLVHSAWAARMFQETEYGSDMPATGTQTILPVQMPLVTVNNMVEALYSGSIELTHAGVEQMLVLSHAMQVRHQPMHSGFVAMHGPHVICDRRKVRELPVTKAVSHSTAQQAYLTACGALLLTTLDHGSS